VRSLRLAERLLCRGQSVISVRASPRARCLEIAIDSSTSLSDLHKGEHGLALHGLGLALRRSAASSAEL